VNAVEAALVTPLVGTWVDATIIELRGERARIQLGDPAVTASASVPPEARPGDVVRLRVARADIAAGEIEFSLD
jgi:hypothetical protein